MFYDLFFCHITQHCASLGTVERSPSSRSISKSGSATDLTACCSLNVVPKCPFRRCIITTLRRVRSARAEFDSWGYDRHISKHVSRFGSGIPNGVILFLESAYRGSSGRLSNAQRSRCSAYSCTRQKLVGEPPSGETSDLYRCPSKSRIQKGCPNAMPHKCPLQHYSDTANTINFLANATEPSGLLAHF